jgi:putative ABC transport system permease protein
MTPLRLAWRTTLRYRARAILAIVGVAVIGALLFDMLLLSRGLLVSLGELLSAEGFDARIVATQGFSRVPIQGSAALAAAVQVLPGVTKVAVIRLESGEVRTGGTAGGRLHVTVIGRAQADGDSWRIVRGANVASASSADCDVVVDRGFPPATGFDVGSSIDVTLSPGPDVALPPVRCRVAGVADFGFNASTEHTIAMTLASLQRATGASSEADGEVILFAVAPGTTTTSVADAIFTIRPDVKVYSNTQAVEQFNQNGFAYFRQISIVLSTLTAAFAFLLVATLLTVSINQRLGEIAALRALGLPRRRIAAMLFWESALLVGTGAVLAVPLGALVAAGLDRLLRQMPGLPEALHFFVFEPRALVIHLAVFAITATASAAYPVWLSARLPIAETLRREVVG